MQEKQLRFDFQGGVGHVQNGVALTPHDVHLQELHVEIVLGLHLVVEHRGSVRLLLTDHIQPIQRGEAAAEFDTREGVSFVVHPVLLRVILLFFDAKKVESNGD